MANIDMMISDNTGLVYAQLNRFGLREDQDAESAAYGALHKAAITYKPNKGVEFSTYATCCIYNALASRLRSLKSQQSVEIVSLSDPVGFDEGNATRLDKICIDNSVESIFVKKENSELLWQAINKAKDKLAGTSAKVIERWIESDFTAKQKELASETGVSQSYISTALGQFKRYLREELAKIQYHY